jgi:hypothetical protein
MLQHPRELFAAMPIEIAAIEPTESFTRERDGIAYKGLWVHFTNGRVLSIQAHYHNYCSHNEALLEERGVLTRTPRSRWNEALGEYQHWTALNYDWSKAGVEHWVNLAETVEIATWIAEGELQDLPGGDQVMGHVTPEQLVRFVAELLTADVRAGFPIASPRIALGADWE